MNGRNILLVDGDAGFRRSLTRELELLAFGVIAAESAGDALKVAPRWRFDAILLNTGLPGMSGLELCRRLRAAGVGTTIVLVADVYDEDELVLGLDGGANDYMAKPLRVDVLLARLRAHMRQRDLATDAVFSVGRYRFHPGAKLLVDEAQRQTVRLTPKEAAMLKYLCRAGSSVTGRETLLNEVWGYDARVSTHTLAVHLYRLRRKIEGDPKNPQILLTEHGSGYRLAL